MDVRENEIICSIFSTSWRKNYLYAFQINLSFFPETLIALGFSRSILIKCFPNECSTALHTLLDFSPFISLSSTNIWLLAFKSYQKWVSTYTIIQYMSFMRRCENDCVHFLAPMFSWLWILLIMDLIWYVSSDSDFWNVIIEVKEFFE